MRAFQTMWHALNKLPAQCGTEHCSCRFGDEIAADFPQSVMLSSIYTPAV
jgi:hypothetical protein